MLSTYHANPLKYSFHSHFNGRPLEMKKEEYKRLEQFFTRKSARQRLVLYLIASGRHVPDLVSFTVGDLVSIKFPKEMTLWRDEVLDLLQDKAPSSPAFVFPSGKPMHHTDFYRIVRRAANAALKRPISSQEFWNYIKRGKL
ncbi:MAG: hypothetical protein FD165_2617 [Gammaproteobacteria bacterium]|nr:MAG: hypothetical protein FD165_2617 [Gammaproteobacteria bacterium]TND01590.1 MAG: hypothetical protein FD120_2538 [Gammaproteobacteria bacterium]